MTLLAVDPGISNGLAVINDARELLLATEIPVIGEGAHRRLNLTSFADIITQFHVMRAVIEDVAARPGQGVSSMFRFGRATGALEGALAALKIPTTFVSPARWKKDLGAKAKQDEDIRALAIQTWPTMAHRFARKADHNRAEAALIGLWALQHSGIRVAEQNIKPIPSGSRVFVGGEGWRTL